MYCVMRASVPSLHNVYRRYDSIVIYSSLGKLSFLSSLCKSILSEDQSCWTIIRMSEFCTEESWLVERLATAPIHDFRGPLLPIVKSCSAQEEERRCPKIGAA